MKRRKMNYRKSRRLFRSTARRHHQKNRINPRRGGVRL